MPAYRERVLAYAPAVARHSVRLAAGVFLGYDFHLGPDGPQLIEINSNAGGALLNRMPVARTAGVLCVGGADAAGRRRRSRRFLAMFRDEWRLARRRGAARPLARIAIVDEAPAEQYLAPEFELFRQLFDRERH
jgi:hypothetical protein